MLWFLIALIGPFLYALTNHIDKFLLKEYFKESGVGTLLLFSALLAVLALPFLYLADRTILDVKGINVAVCAIVGILNVAVLWCYLLAMREEEASIVTIFYQLLPVFGCLLGYFILGETLTRMQVIAMATIIFGTTIIFFEIDAENKFRLRKKTVLLMLASSFFWALGSVIFKAVALEENVWRTLFWEHVMLVLVGIGIFTFMRSYRDHFLRAIRSNSKMILSLNFVNESLYMIGNLVFSFAYILAPIALVLLADSFQPIFVLAIGIFLAVFFPKATAERMQARHLWQKIIAICITGIGTYLLLTS